MNLPVALQSSWGLIVLVVVVGLFWWLTQRRRLADQQAIGSRVLPEKGFACEWVSTPLVKAKKDMLKRFPELESTLGSERPNDVHLIRFGLFNMQEAPLEAINVTRPVEIVFPDDARILSATFGESLKTTPSLETPPAIEGSRVTLPAFRMDPRSTVIFNLIVQGSRDPSEVLGETEGHGPLKRVS